MNSVIYNPLEEYENKFKNLHLDKTRAFFDELVTQSGVNIEENRKTVEQYNTYKENLTDLKNKYNLWRVLRVIMIITLVLIPVVILKITPGIQGLREEIELADSKAGELLDLALQQMEPLNNLFTDKDSVRLTGDTIPLMSFDPFFSAKREQDMIINYDYNTSDYEESTIDVLSGEYNENPFLFRKKVVHTMGEEVYHGYKTITWSETYRDSNGKLCTRTRTQTLHATVTKPKPIYSQQIVLEYGSQGGPGLSFTRDATHLHRKSDKSLERYVKRGEKRIKRKTDKAISRNEDFVGMSNTDFEVLFDALDRNNEVQFRTLFTPLAQTNMVDLLLSEVGYGDDFAFEKNGRMNKIISVHSQGRGIYVPGDEYTSYSFDIIRDNFISKNCDFFRAVYFDFAPLLAIPLYQERPVQSLKPVPDSCQRYSVKECEALANAMCTEYVVHPQTKTPAILKADFVASGGEADETCIRAFSYDIAPRVDIVPMPGGDGRYHNVSVPWDEYIPLEARNNFYVTACANARHRDVLVYGNELCILKK